MWPDSVGAAKTQGDDCSPWCPGLDRGGGSIRQGDRSPSALRLAVHDVGGSVADLLPPQAEDLPRSEGAVDQDTVTRAWRVFFVAAVISDLSFSRGWNAASSNFAVVGWGL